VGADLGRAKEAEATVNADENGRPDVGQVLSGLRDFQRRTVDHVFERMYDERDPALRFLVADEVGLGKTFVARGVVARIVDHLWEHVDRIDVVYICSNQDIARQNLDRLNIAGDEDAVHATRLTLLAEGLRRVQGRKLNFVSFTPGTSFERHEGMGRARERVLLYWLLKRQWRFGESVAPLNVLQGWSGAASFRKQVKDWGFWAQFPWAPSLTPLIRKSFNARLREHAAVAKAEGKPTLRRRFKLLCEQMPRTRAHHAYSEEVRTERIAVIAELRAVLAAACVTALEPDVVILDEFQRFRYLLDPEDDASRLAHELFTYGKTHEKGEFHERCRTLLLSATPYKMFTTAREAGEDDHYRDFLETTGFLFDGDQQVGELREHLGTLRRELLRLDSGGFARIPAVRDRIEDLLRRVMVRTERLAVTGDRNGMLGAVDSGETRLAREDVEAYLNLQAVARELDHHDTVEFWKSSPYLLNFMEGYGLKRGFTRAVSENGGTGLPKSGAGFLPWSGMERYRRVDPGNARLRQLHHDMIGSGAWSLLWLPPSLPYYGLAGPFAEPTVRDMTKRLVFSAWKVAPKAIAGVLSYEAEREMMCSRGGRPLNTQEAREKRARLLEFSRGGRLRGMPLLALMYPSIQLAGEIDPLALARELTAHAAPSRAQLLGLARSKARDLLRPVVAKHAGSGAGDEAWYWAAPFLIDAHADPEATERWLNDPSAADLWAGTSGASGESGFAAHVEEARRLLRGEVDLGRPPRDLASVVADLAVGGPANCVLRAFGRVAELDGLEDEARDAAGSTAFALRRLFNAPEVIAVVRGRRKGTPYWRRVLEYSIDGCLQAVLDEYVHVLIEAEGLTYEPAEVRIPRLAEKMDDVIGVSPSRMRVDDIDLKRPDEPIKRQNMRARFAVRFGVEDTTEDGETTRSDRIRGAFNSPFWPFVLASTSVGQEGLDFHSYCHAVVHWNLPSNPVDLEQREGRVHRYKGHAVRKNLARDYGPQALSNGTGDPWALMFDQAHRDRAKEDSDLVPYWVYMTEGGAQIERHIPVLPVSRDAARISELVGSLAVYRMVFGQPRQDDLVELLLRQLPAGEEDEMRAMLDELRIDLSPR
jgi:hypothetical protein